MSDQVAQLLAGGQSGVNQGTSQCLVCFEEVEPSKLNVQLPCGHGTCDTCWQV